jgi:predicted anti-sigma-YlaC factor YlaD
MICGEYQQQISKLLDNALEKSETAQLFAHLGGCAECRQFFELTLRIRRAILAGPRVTLPEKLSEPPVRTSVAAASYASDRHLASEGRPRRALAGIRTGALLVLLTLIAGLFWSTAISTRSEQPSDYGLEANGPQIPNWQP